MASEPVRNTAVVTAPKDYSVPAAQSFRLLSVEAEFTDNGATVDWLPALQLLDNNGNVLVTAADQGVKITAGSSASVSWFPGISKGSISASGVRVVGARIETNVTQSVADTTVTDLHYQVVGFDTGGMVNLAANDRIITITQPGLYLVVCETYWPWSSGAKQNRRNAINLNSYETGVPNNIVDDQRSAIWAPLAGPGPQPHTTNLSVGFAQLVAGDFISSGCEQQSGGALAANGTGAAFLSAIMLGTA